MPRGSRVPGEAGLTGDVNYAVVTADAAVPKPLGTERVYFVTPRGNDANDGLTLRTAKATIGSAMAAANATETKPTTIQLGYGTITQASTVQVSAKGVKVLGPFHDRNDGAQISFTGTGPLFQLGTDDGLALDGARYDGVAADFYASGWSAVVASPATALANGRGNYGSGTYGVRDWRCGGVVFEHVLFENFQFGFWGVQSDMDVWTDAQFRYCRTGAYFGPRSDQLRATALGGFYNDTLVEFDRAMGAKVDGLICTFNGSASTPPVKIGSSYASSGSAGITLNEPWFENGGSYPSFQAYVEVGIGGAATSTDVRINNPLIIQSLWTGSGTGQTRFLVKMEQANGVIVENPGGYGYLNLERLLNFVGSTSPRCRVRVRGTEPDAGFVNSGTGTPHVTIERYADYGSVGATILEPLTVLRRGGASGFTGTLNARTAAVVESNAGSGTALAVLAPNTGWSALYLGDQDSETIGQVYYDHTNNALSVVTLGVERLRIDNAGAVILGSGGTGPQVRFGAGSPEGAVTAPVGSLYLRSDGGTGTSLYVKESGAGNTGWVAK